jgi:hypothetical protein
MLGLVALTRMAKIISTGPRFLCYTRLHPPITSAEAVVASVEGIEAAVNSEITVKLLQAYHRNLE